MKQVLVGIFAHPDDEAFGPSGTLLKLAGEDVDVHLVLMTDGEAGSNPDNVPNLGESRIKEWQTSSQLLGSTSTVALHFPDGKLTETIDDAAYSALERELKRITDSYDEPIELSLMTFEPHGITEHVDHVTASRLTTRLFGATKANVNTHVTPGKLWYYCLSLEQAPITDQTTYYVPRGREESFITDRIDVASYLKQKYAVIDAHVTQRADGDATKKLGDQMLATEHFRVVS